MRFCGTFSPQRILPFIGVCFVLLMAGSPAFSRTTSLKTDRSSVSLPADLDHYIRNMMHTRLGMLSANIKYYPSFKNIPWSEIEQSIDNLNFYVVPNENTKNLFIDSIHSGKNIYLHPQLVKSIQSEKTTREAPSYGNYSDLIAKSRSTDWFYLILHEVLLVNNFNDINYQISLRLKLKQQYLFSYATTSLDAFSEVPDFDLYLKDTDVVNSTDNNVTFSLRYALLNNFLHGSYNFQFRKKGIKSFEEQKVCFDHLQSQSIAVIYSAATQTTFKRVSFENGVVYTTDSYEDFLSDRGDNLKSYMNYIVLDDIASSIFAELDFKKH